MPVVLLTWLKEVAGRVTERGCLESRRFWIAGYLRQASGFAQYMVSRKMAGFNWNVWPSECTVRTASVLLQCATAFPVLPWGAKIQMLALQVTVRCVCFCQKRVFIAMVQGALLRVTGGL